VARVRTLFVGFLASAVALFVAWAWLGDQPHEIGSSLALVRPCVFVLALASAAATWGVAVMAASVYRVVWPLVTAVAAVVSGLAVVFRSWLAG
jgi:hypothetical protein